MIAVIDSAAVYIIAFVAGIVVLEIEDDKKLAIIIAGDDVIDQIGDLAVTAIAFRHLEFNGIMAIGIVIIADIDRLDRVAIGREVLYSHREVGILVKAVVLTID